MAKIEVRLAQYLAGSNGPADPLSTVMSAVRRALPDTVVFGGMVRDFSLNTAARFDSDIDLVTQAPAGDIWTLIRSYSPVRNKFGGFRFTHQNRLFDIWSLEDTWAIREGIVQGGQLDRLPHTSFFNLDAAIFNLEHQTVHAIDDYRQHVNSRTLDINLPDNPKPADMALRAVRMALNKDLQVSSRLGRFVLDHLPDAPPGFLIQSFARQLATHLDHCNEPFRFAPQRSFW